MNLREVNAELSRVTREIEVKSHELGELRDAWLRAKESAQFCYDSEILSCKAKNPKATQTDIAAQAGVTCRALKLQEIAAESKYRACSDVIRGLRDRMEAAKEVSFNLRKEASI